MHHISAKDKLNFMSMAGDVEMVKEELEASLNFERRLNVAKAIDFFKRFDDFSTVHDAVSGDVIGI